MLYCHYWHSPDPYPIDRGIGLKGKKRVGGGEGVEGEEGAGGEGGGAHRLQVDAATFQGAGLA